MFTSFVSSRSLSVRGPWGTAPSVFWYGAPGGTQGPLGKGGAAERWRVAYPIGIATRHGAKPATTRTYKSRQNALGAVPQDPLAAKLRLDTDWAFQLPLKSRSAQRRRYALKVPAAHYMWGNCKSAAESYHRKACASLSNEGNELKNFPHSRSVNVEDCGEYIAGFGFQCYRLTSFLSVRPSR